MRLQTYDLATARHGRRRRLPRRGRVSVLAASVTLLLAAIGVAFTSPGATTSASAAPGDLVWADEFNGARGTLPDGSRWNIEQGGGGWGNAEHQYYTNRPENVSHDGNGNLAITARRENPSNLQCWYGRCEYTSARITTQGRFAPKYGRIEANIKIPRGQGIWPAFWSLGDDIGQVGWPRSGEIDIMENVGKEPSNVYGTLHGPGYSAGSSVSARYSLPNNAPFADAFHRFAVDWSPDRITWSVDGVAYRTMTPADVRGNPWVFNKPFFLLLNVAVGGYWPGYPDASTQFPQTMLIDYVRVYDNSGAPPPPPPATGTRIVSQWHGKCIDVPNWRFEDGQRLIVWSCTNGTNQRWELVDGTLRTQNNKCMDVAWGSRENGAAIQIANCSGNAAQQFVLSGAGDLVNPQANKCVDIAGWNPNDDAVLQLWECTGGANQRWRLG